MSEGGREGGGVVDGIGTDEKNKEKEVVKR